MPSISVVLPAHNEEENLPQMLRATTEVLSKITSDYEIIVVDDGSTDHTAEITQSWAQSDAHIRLQQHPRNVGYGGALATGFAAATKELVLLTDSDNQFDVTEINKLLPLIDQADLVVGYRAPRRDPFVRRLNGLGWNMLVNLLFGYTCRDVDCAFKLFKRSILQKVRIVSRGATFSAEFLVRARRQGYRIREVPVKHLPRLAGVQSGARPDVIWRAFGELVRFRLTLWREKRSGQGEAV
ncbi:MAG: glycosyltransferase family 2 protein [Chloroflexi bacterium]|nr:glycosyltransferase family 2 protein [Chloroflexota bacterium]MCL5074051.1 glycosyltransferase family 2 protein [Chloroflexota bacterium]